MMRQQVAAFAGLMERKLDELDGGPGAPLAASDWTRESYGFLLDRLESKVKELAGTFHASNPTNAAVSALEAVEVGNCAMMLVDKLTGGRLSALPRNLADLPRTTKPTGGDKTQGHWFRWLLTSRGESAQVLSGRVFSVSDEKAMVVVRDAALADKVPRPFEVTIARIFRVEDEVVQKTAEVTSL